MLNLLADAAAGAAAEPAWYYSGAMKYMIDGGPFMWPILFMAILGLAVIIERFRSLSMLTGNSDTLRLQVFGLLHQGRLEEAIDTCVQSRGPVPAILAVGLHRFGLLRRLNHDPVRIEEQVDKAMEDYGAHIVAALERHMPILSTIANVAPMVGSIGTVVGMVILFNDIVNMPSTASIMKVAAGGIQVKLLVTVFGLLVGVPAYIFYTYFNTKIGRLVLDAEETASKLIEALTVKMGTGTAGNTTTTPAAKDFVA
jgi:biopolymer transport protein ExbB